jgi:sulfonate transport system substrate-binding protein
MTAVINRRALNLGLAASVAAPYVARAADPVKIRIGWIVTPASMVPLALEKKDLMRNFGKTYIAEAIRFEGTPLAITAMAAGDLICDESEDGFPGYGTNEFMVLKDSPIKTVADLKGKVLATNTVGSAVDVGIRAHLRKNGLEAQKDYTIVEAPFPTMKAVLADKKADLISAVPPFSLDPQLRSISRTLFTQRDAFGVSLLSVWAARKPFIDKNRAALIDFIEDTLRTNLWYTDPKNHAEAVALLSKITKAPPERLNWAFTKDDQYRDPNGMPNLKAMQANLDQQKAVGLLTKDIDVMKYSDTSLVEEAAKRLK